MIITPLIRTPFLRYKTSIPATHKITVLGMFTFLCNAIKRIFKKSWLNCRQWVRMRFLDSFFQEQTAGRVACTVCILLAVRIDCRLLPLGSFIAIRCINSGAFFMKPPGRGYSVFQSREERLFLRDTNTHPPCVAQNSVCD